MAGQPASTYLRIYLQDHHAGATGGLRLAERAALRHDSGELGIFLARLASEIREDRMVLERIMNTFGYAPSSVKDAAVYVAELVGRLKPNGRVLAASPLSTVVELETLTVGICGKRALWQSLEQVTDGRLDVDFRALAARAERQLEGLERHRVVAARAALGLGVTQAKTPNQPE